MALDAQSWPTNVLHMGLDRRRHVLPDRWRTWCAPSKRSILRSVLGCGRSAACVGLHRRHFCGSALVYAGVTEIPSAKKSVVIARFCYATVNIVANVLTPYQLNPTAWGWGARSGSFWAGSCALLLIFTYFFVPEPKDRPIAELDLLFEKKVSARNFSKPKSTYPRAQRTKMQLDILRSGSAEVRILRAYHLFDEAKSQRASRGPVC